MTKRPKDEAGTFLPVGAKRTDDLRAKLDELAGPPLGGPVGPVLPAAPIGRPRCSCGWEIPLIQFRMLVAEDIAVEYTLQFACPRCGFVYRQGKRELEDLGAATPPKLKR